MAEVGGPCAFPVLVQGDWGAPAPPKLLRNKLLCYFQSRKKSGGGECEIQQGSGLVLVCFAQDEVRQRVLSRQNHELDLGGKGTLKLVVKLYEATGAAKEDAPVKEMVPKEPSIIEDQTKEKDVQKVLQKEVANGSKDTLSNSQASSLVVLENVNITLDMLMLLVENISDLSGEDFQIEFISERNAAVIKFQRSIDATNFLERCSKNARIKKYKINSRRLELMQMIKIENIPSGVCKGFLTLYFESSKNGGGQVSNIQMLPKEDAAIITFCDHKAVHTILKKQHSLKNQPVLVYPYCSFLNTALYGKERPQIKMPEPVSVPLDPYIWQFLQGKDKLIQEIENEMALCYCELIWPQKTCEQPKITMQPSAALSKQGASGRELIKAWKEKVCSELACIMSKFKTAKCAIISAAWETIESTLIKNVLAIPDSAKESVILAGFVYIVDNVEKAIKQHIENVIKDAEKAKETIQQTLFIPPHKFAVLHHILQEENLYQENRDVKCSCNFETKTILLSGILTDVYRMKSDILEKINNMVETKANIHPNIFHFLQHTDSGQLSKIFCANNIYASYELELESNSVALVGQTPEALLKAGEQMKECLDQKCIVLEDRELMNKKEWKELIKKLERKHNSGEGTVSIDECLDLEEDAKVIIAGYTSAVADVYQMLSNFVERNTRMLKVIPAKSVAVVQYMEKEKENSWQDLRRRGVKINFGEQAKQKNIILSGPKAEVIKGATVVEEMLSSVHSLIVTFDKPGVKAFFKAREYSYVAEAKNSFNCLIRLQKDDELSGVSEEKGNPHAKITLKDGIVIEACKGDLTKYRVDVVVNASNEDLKHIGGLADALSKAAGLQLQKECDALVKRHGSLRPGCAIMTSAGNLPCKQVIHAVGPRWSNSSAQKCMLLLKKAVKESLKLAETYNHRSIAIPAISSGVFGFPMKECAHAIVTAIKESLEDSSENGSLKKICLVDVSEDTVQALAEALCEAFRQDPLPPPPAPQAQSASPPKAVRDHLHTVTSPAGLKLILKQKGIEDATTDVVVSSIGSDLKLGVGPLSKALLQKAGPMLQAEFEQAVQGQGAQGGCLIQTGGYNLSCKYLLHAIVPQWDAGKGHAMKKLGDIVGKCLEKTEELSLSSISFPAIGTGGFAFPKSEVAKLMYDKVFQFRGMKSLQEVHFLLHANDKDNIQAFSEVFGCRLEEIPGAVPSDKKTAGYFGGISSPALGVNEMQIGSIKFQSMTGDITHQDTDVIVNVTNANFNSKSGVSKAILEGGGPVVEVECAALALQPHNGFVTTQGGNLTCKKIIHLAPNSNIRTQVSKVLRECEAKQYRSVAFPAIGTGQAQKTPEDAAEEMMSAISDFAGKESPQYLETVKIIIFQSHLQNAFYEAMKKREGVALPTSESMFSRFKAYVTGKIAPSKKKHLLVLDKKVEVAVFEICGENRKKVEDVESWLKTLILQELAEERIVDELIDTFGDTEMQTLNELQKRLHVAIELEKTQSSPSIRIFGTTRDVLTAVKEIQCLIKKLKEVREEESKATLAKNLVEWQYSKRKDVFLPVDMFTNLHLEDTKISNKTHVDIKIHGKNYRADIKNMCATDDHGKSVKLQRIVKEEGRLYGVFPKEWEDMKGNRVKAVMLQPMLQEYKDLEAKFQLSCPSYRIEKIERIQNPFLWQSYQAKKEDMARKNGHDNNEKILFHGTPYSTVIPINNTGFNRSYAGKNAAMIGNGTYFAVDASYSAQDTYATPDNLGRKYMYVARVLTGEYCIGKHGQIIPPSKNGGGFDLFDSVTDNMANPSMFVIFHDAQAYPEYLITFRK